MTTTELKSLLASEHAELPIHAVVRALSAGGTMSSADLQSVTSLAKSTISNALFELRESGIVVESGHQEKAAGVPGRRPVKFQINPKAGTCVGVHLELNGIRACVADMSHSIIDEQFIQLQPDYTPQQGVTAAKRLVQKLYAENGLPFSHLLGVGVSVSGPVGPRGDVHRSSILPAWAGTNVKQLFSAEFSAPVHADNESNCAAISEMMWGAAAGFDSFVFYKADLGVGGAVVCGGKVLVGAAGGAGEFGHMSLNRHGPICRCGNRGCVELEAGLRASVELMSNMLGQNCSVDELLELVEKGDEAARRLLNDAGEAAGHGLAAVCSVLNPPLIIIGGRSVLAGDIFLAPLTREFEKHSMIKPHDVSVESRTEIRIGNFIKNDALLGAVGLVLRSLAER